MLRTEINLHRYNELHSTDREHCTRNKEKKKKRILRKEKRENCKLTPDIQHDHQIFCFFFFVILVISFKKKWRVLTESNKSESKHHSCYYDQGILPEKIEKNSKLEDLMVVIKKINKNKKISDDFQLKENCSILKLNCLNNSERKITYN